MNKGLTIWFTGLPGVGKTTIAHLLEKKLREWCRNVEIVDDDIVKTHLSQDLNFSRQDHDTTINRIIFVCKLLARNGVVVISDVISPYRDTRDKARKEIGSFIEVHLKCSKETRVDRDVTEHNKKIAGVEAQGYKGIHNSYEEPLNPEIIIETDKETGEEAVNKIVKNLIDSGYLNPNESPQNVYSSEEEEKIKERLKRLGYL